MKIPHLAWIAPLLGILTLAGMFLSFYSKTYKWDESVNDMALLKVKASAYDSTLATIVAQLQDLKADVQDMNDQLDRMDHQ